MEGGVPASSSVQGGAIRLETSLADLSSVPGVDPRRCLKGPILPKGISNLRVLDILNLFLEGVVEQLQKPEDYSSATTTANGTPCTAPSLASSSGRSSTRSSYSHFSASSAKAKAKPRVTRSTSPPLPRTTPSAPPTQAPPNGSGHELRKLRQQAAQCQEFKDMSEQAKSEVVRMEGEVQELREQVVRLSRQNKQLLLQLRQQRFQHQQELRLCRNPAEEGLDEDVNLLTYLHEAPEQTDLQLQKDLQRHSADVRVCLKSALRHALLEQFGQLELDRGIAIPMDGVCSHVKQLWSILHTLWSSENLEEIVEDSFHASSRFAEDLQWPEVAENTEKQALQMLERLSATATASPSCDSRAKPYHVPEPHSAGSDDREGNSQVEAREVSESPAQQQRRRSRLQGVDPTLASLERLPSTPSFGSPWRLRGPSRSPSPSDPQRNQRHAPNMPAVLIAGPVLSRAARPPRTNGTNGTPTAAVSAKTADLKSRRPRSPEPSLSPRVPTKRNEVRPRSLSPEMAKRLQKVAFR